MTALHSSVRELVGIPPARARQAVHAGQVAGVGQLPGQADRRVQADARTGRPAARPPWRVAVAAGAGRSTRVTSAVPLADHARTRPAWPGPARSAGSSASADPGGPAGVGAGGLVGQGLDHGQQGRALEEREPPGAEVVGQGAERLGPERRPAGAVPTAATPSNGSGRGSRLAAQGGGHGSRRRRSGARGRAASVDAAHAVDGDVLDQQLLVDQGGDVRAWVSVEPAGRRASWRSAGRWWRWDRSWDLRVLAGRAPGVGFDGRRSNL